MIFRKGVENDIKNIMEIIKEAQDYFKANNIDQWQNGYPDFNIIKNDIKHNYNYVLKDQGKILASAAISFENEPTYDNIYKGKWLSEEKYAVVHRIVVSNKFKGFGLSSKILINVEKTSLEKGIHSIKIDTHKENISMQRLLIKNNFQYCGVIFLEDGAERVAFEKLI